MHKKGRLQDLGTDNVSAQSGFNRAKQNDSRLDVAKAALLFGSKGDHDGYKSLLGNSSVR